MLRIKAKIQDRIGLILSIGLKDRDQRETVKIISLIIPPPPFSLSFPPQKIDKTSAATLRSRTLHCSPIYD
jgi:hypothetical protein